MDDSDDEVVQHKTKTQIKKDDRKITEKTKGPLKPNAEQMEAGGFEYVAKPQDNEPKKGGKEASRGGRGRGGTYPRGGRGGARPVRMDADGNKIGAGSNARERVPFAGKPREEAHPMDRKSGTGRGRRPQNKRDGAGKGNVGMRDDVAYKKKVDDGEEQKTEDKPEEKQEEAQEEEKKEEEPKVIVKTEVIGISMDDFMN